MGDLTDRQRAILDRLEKQMSAQEIAQDLGVTRNAVYQQIQAIRKKGHLSPAYTPSGQAPRSLDAPVVLNVEDGQPIAAQSLALLAQVADQLDMLVAQIRKHTG